MGLGTGRQPWMRRRPTPSFRFRGRGACAQLARVSPEFRWFIIGLGSWFGAWGMQSVLFSWLVVGELHASADAVSAAQTSSMLPTLILILFGGLVADRLDARKVLVRLQALAALPVLLLAAAVASGKLTLLHLLIFGSCIGTVMAFTMPARDTLLSRIAGGNLMHAITVLTAVQFGAQALGSLTAGLASRFGAVSMLCLQALLLLAGAAALAQLSPAAPNPHAAPPTTPLRDIAAGLAVVAKTPRLRAPIALVLAVGTFFVGPFMVLFPLLVRDTYHGGVAELSLIVMMFPLGTISGSLLLRAAGGIRRKGLASQIALLGGAAVLAVIGIGLPFAGTVLATYLWGAAGSVFINCSRTLYQEAAPAAHRGRVLSVFQLGFMGGSPIGAILAGLVAQSFGSLHTLWFFAGAMLLFVASSMLFSGLSRME